MCSRYTVGQQGKICLDAHNSSSGCWIDKIQAESHSAHSYAYELASVSLYFSHTKRWRILEQVVVVGLCEGVTTNTFKAVILY